MQNSELKPLWKSKNYKMFIVATHRVNENGVREQRCEQCKQWTEEQQIQQVQVKNLIFKLVCSTCRKTAGY